MRWIHHGPDGRLTHGEDAPVEIPAEGVLTCMAMGPGTVAIVDGVMYIDGKKASPGLRRLTFRNGVLPIAITKGGRPEFRPIEPRGGV